MPEDFNNKLKLVVGLGNPEPRYWETRHNAGFWVVDRIATKYSATAAWSHKRDLHADTTKVNIEGVEVVLAKPTTYMNLSGRAIAAIMNWFKIPQSNLLIIHDEVALDLGRIRIQFGRGAGGHHGIESTFQSIGKDAKFACLRVGVGPDPGGDVRGDYVLSPIPAQQQQLKEDSIALAVDAAYTWVVSGHKEAANKFNGINLNPPPPPPPPLPPTASSPAEPSADPPAEPSAEA